MTEDNVLKMSSESWMEPNKQIAYAGFIKKKVLIYELPLEHNSNSHYFRAKRSVWKTSNCSDAEGTF